MVKQEIVELLHQAGIDANESQLEKPAQAEYGEFSFPCFHLAKKLKKDPVDIADEIAERIKVPRGSIVQKVDSVKGYVNFYLNYKKFSSKVLKQASKKISIGKGKRVMVEYSSPNPVHPLHIGHARSTFLGDSLANIFSLLNCKVIRANLMNDIGLQVAKLVYAYTTWASGKSPQGKADNWLWQYYVKFHEEMTKDTLHEENARFLLRNFEQGTDKNLIKTWDKVVKWCVEGFEETYKRLGIKFDVYFYEHDFRDLGKKIVSEAIDKQVAMWGEEGGIVADLEHYGMPNIVLLRSDGTGLYVTSDLGLTFEKFRKYNLDMSMWVVSSQQDLYFKQLFKIFELMEYKWHKECYHFSYETVRLPDGKMSSREGRAIILDEVIDKIVTLAYAEVAKRNPEMSEEKKLKIAEQIGIGALKYAIVRIEPQNQITFGWKQMLSLEGNTGPYIQYSHTRCTSILKKVGEFKKVYSFKEISANEKNLIKKISEFPDVVNQAASEMKPHLICNYVYDLATIFNSFYQKVPVLKTENEKQKNFRLTLVDATRNVFQKCLNLIGIEVPEKM